MISILQVAAQDFDVVPCSYVSRKLQDTIEIGNCMISARIWAEKDGLYLMLDSGSIKIDVKPCIWDFNHKEILDYGNGMVTFENSYIKFKIFTQRDSPALWIKGKRDTSSEISIIKKGESWPYDIVSEGLDKTNSDFTVRISSGNIEYINYKKAYNINSLYWNEFWQRSFIKIEGKDSTITNTYNRNRWKSATCTNPDYHDIYNTIVSADWDIFKANIRKMDSNIISLALMLKYYTLNEDEFFLNSDIVPLAEKVLYQDSIQTSNKYYRYSCNELRKISNEVLIPKRLLDYVSSVQNGTECDLDFDQYSLQEIIIDGKFPANWNFKFRFPCGSSKYISGEHQNGKWKRKPQKKHQDFFL